MRDQLLAFVEEFKSDKRMAAFDEAATKQIVLLRLLPLLGWNIYDIDEVVPEYSVGNQRVDYALRYSNTNKAFIEVKKIGEDLDRHQEQLLNYSFKEGVPLSILTNGIAWRFYLPLHEGSWEQRRFYTIEIYDQDSKDIVARFVDYLARENVCAGRSIQIAEEVIKGRQKEYLVRETLPKAWNKLMSEPDEILVELISDATEKLCGYKPEVSVVENFIFSDISIGQTSNEILSRKQPARKPTVAIEGSYIGKSVTAFTFRNTRYEVKYWIDVLTQICRLMYDVHRRDFGRVLQLQGRKRPYFTRNRDELRVPQQVEDSGIYVETNLSSNQIVKISTRVVLLFGYSDKSFTITMR